MNPTPGQRPAWFDEELFPVDSHFATIDDCNVHYVDEGQGPTLLLLHGNPTWSFLYRDMIADLSSDFRCIAPDYPGMGLSQARRGYAFGPEEHARIIQGLVRQLDLTDVTLVMQDWGGPIGMSAAAADPDRYARLVIGNTWFWPFDDVAAKAFSWLLGGPIGTQMHKRANLFVERVIPFAHSLVKPGPREMDMWRGPYPTPESREPTHVFPERVTGARPFLAQTLYDAHRTGLVERPTLLLWATEDGVFRLPVLRRHEGMFLDHTTVMLDGANHYWQDDAPGAACRAIRTWFARGSGDRAAV